MRLLSKISDILDFAASALAGIITIVLTTITLAGVIYRFVLDNPIVWVYEFTVVCFAWMIFLGMSMAFKRKEQISLTFLSDALPEGARVWLSRVILLVLLVFLVISTKEGVAVSQSTWYQVYNTVPISKGLFYASLPVSAVISFVHILLEFLETFTGSEKKETVQSGVEV
jgi:C4-dicarboxylate transporter DctQ subunit